MNDTFPALRSGEIPHRWQTAKDPRGTQPAAQDPDSGWKVQTPITPAPGQNRHKAKAILETRKKQMDDTTKRSGESHEKTRKATRNSYKRGFVE